MSGRAVSSPVIGSGVAWAALICRRPAVARAPHRAVVGATRLSMSDIVFRVEEENKRTRTRSFNFFSAIT